MNTVKNILLYFRKNYENITKKLERRGMVVSTRYHDLLTTLES